MGINSKLRLISGNFGNITIDPSLSNACFGACEVGNGLRLVIFDETGDFAFIVRTKVTDVISSGIENDVEHFVRIFVGAVFICKYVEICGTNDMLGVVSIENEEVANVLNVRYVKRNCVRSKMIVYIVVVIIAFVEYGVRKKTDFAVIVLEVSERRTDDFGAEERSACGNCGRNIAVRGFLTYRISPCSACFVKNGRPGSNVSENVEYVGTVHIGDDRETGSNVQTVRSVLGSDPTNDIAVVNSVICTGVFHVNSGSFRHHHEGIESPLFVSYKLVDINVTDRFGIGVNGFIVDERVCAIESGTGEVADDAVELVITVTVFDREHIYVSLVEIVLRKINAAGTEIEKVINFTAGSKGSRAVFVVENTDFVAALQNVVAGIAAGRFGRYTLDGAVVKLFDQFVSLVNSEVDGIGVGVVFLDVDFLSGVTTVIKTVVADDNEYLAAEVNVFVTGHFFGGVEFWGGVVVVGRTGAAGAAGRRAAGRRTARRTVLGSLGGVFGVAVIAACREKNTKDHD